MFITAVISYGVFCRGCVVGDDRGVEREKYSVMEIIRKRFYFLCGFEAVKLLPDDGIAAILQIKQL